MLFKRFSRSRSNSQSQSYVDSYHSPVDSKTNSASYDDAAQAYDSNLPSSRQSNVASSQQQQFSYPTGQETSVDNMYPHSSNQAAAGGSAAYASPRMNGGYGNSIDDGYEVLPSSAQQPSASSGTKGLPASASSASAATGAGSAPESLLLHAFNQALRPHLDKVDQLEAEIADLRAYIDQLEQQRSDVHAWIDKRGLRPDVPPSIASQMDSASHANSPTHAAATLNAQLDRKITIVNFDLHRLQDDLNDSLPTPSFSACMLKFLPDISRLSSLHSGPRYAFDLLLKLGGNLNSHGGLENGDQEDLAERRAFYGRLDDAMVDVVRGRFKEEGDGWGVQREIKRIEKTGAYLKNWGVEPYFPQTLDVMKQESMAGGSGATAQQTSGSGMSGEGY